MAASPPAQRAPLPCPSCGYEWHQLPAPMPTPGVQPMFFRCPNRHCRHRHHIIIYKLVVAPQLRVLVLRVVKSFGSDPASLRQSLEQVEEIDPDLIEFIITVSMLQPELINARPERAR